MSPQTPQPEHVDYTGAPLRVGQNVTFIHADQDRTNGSPRLYTGEVKFIGTDQVVIESAEELFLIAGRDEESRQRRAVRYVTLLGLPAPPDSDE